MSGMPVEGRMGASEVVEQQGLAARVDETITRASRALLSVQCPAGTGRVSSRSAAHLEAEYVFVNRLLGRQRPEQDRRMAERLLATAAGRRRMGTGAGPAGPPLDDHPGLPGAEAGGARNRRAGARARARSDPRRRRPGGVGHVHALLARLLRAVPVDGRAARAGRDGAAADLGAAQHLPPGRAGRAPRWCRSHC